MLYCQLSQRSYVPPTALIRLNLMRSSHCLVLSCLVLSYRWCEQNWRQVKTVSSSRHRISRLDKTVSKLSVADGLDLLPILFTPQHGQDRTVLSCMCRRCELGIRLMSYETFVVQLCCIWLWFLQQVVLHKIEC